MAGNRKRPRPELEESRAECPFSIRLVDPKEKEQKGKKRRKKSEGEEDENAKKILHQLSPFSPSGKFKSFDTMDVHYMVEPPKKWSEMTRYNSFVLNGVKYFSEGFIYVANESTIERQKAIANKDSLQPRKKSDDDWVARILEIRASDEHHVYARVYWMYWPDELPAGTHDGKRTVQGRQPYHGVNELIASNHMDIINVVSVTSLAQVNQMIEDNDDDVQNALYWRQAVDVRTFELSTVEAVCKCGQPANPDKTLIGCANDACGKWLHDECLQHEVLTKVYERLGKTTPHVKTGAKDKKDDEEATRPLSPTETGAAVSAQNVINVNADGEGANGSSSSDRINDNVDVGGDAAAATGSEERATSSRDGSSLDGPSSSKPSTTPVKRLPGRPKLKKNVEEGDPSRPYEGLFEANLRTDVTPPMMEITDLRGLDEGETTWMEPLFCLLCGHQIQ